MHTFSKSLKREFHRSRTLVFVIFVFCMAVVASFLSTSNMTNSSAANASNFKPGNIISDAVMANYNTMTVADIQAFLDSKNQCNNTDYNYYLQLTKSQPTIKWHWAGEPYNGHFVCLAEERFGDGEVIGTGMTAAEIIYDAAQVNKINPQVLLVLLQKESSLITDKVPNDFDYRKATGYGCPDTAACDSKYYGFKNQIYRAAELFRYTLDYGSVTFPEGRNVYVGYHPNSSCGGSTVFIENRATASLYRYTPYQPNSAALNAGYGVGNTCSAYGNRNFYLYFTDWFGSTQIAIDGEMVVIPDGEYSLVSSLDSSLSLGVRSTNAELAKLDINNNSQRWNIRRDASTGYYQITNVETGLPLIVSTTTASAGTKVINGQSTTCSKNWRIYRTGDNYLTFETACTNSMVLNATGSASGSSTEVQISSKSKSEKWNLYVGPAINDGTYVVTSSLNSERAIDVMDGKTTDGANVAIWDVHGLPNQVWQFTYQPSTDTYLVKNAKSGKALDLNSGKATNGQNIQIWSAHGECSQRWKIVKTDNDQYHFISACEYGKSLDLNNGNPINSQNIQVWTTHDGNSQKWNLTPKEPIVAEGTYSIMAKSSDDLVLDIADGKTTDGANVIIWQHHGLGNQRWEITYNASTDTYNIFNPATNKSLDLNSGKAIDGQNIQIWTSHGECSQRWNITKASDGYFYITSACNKNISLDVADGKIINGANVLAWTLHGGNNQQWQLIKQD